MWEALCTTHPISLSLAAAYIVAALAYYSDRYFRAVGVVTLLVLLTPSSWFAENVEVIHMQVLYSIVYGLMVVMLTLGKKLIPAGALTCMIMYMLIFSLDTWVNGDVETWVYINHESIVVCLHIIILLSFSQKLSSLVGTCLAHIRSVRYISGAVEPDVSSIHRHERKKEARG